MNTRCGDCSKIMAARLLKNHMDRVHKKSHCIFYCIENFCDRSFNSLNSLRAHHKRSHIRPIEESLVQVDTVHNISLDEEVDSIESNQDVDNQGSDIINNEILLTCGDADNEDEDGNMEVENIVLSSNISHCDYDKQSTATSFFPMAFQLAATFYGDHSLSRLNATKAIGSFNKLLNNEAMNSLKSSILHELDGHEKQAAIAERFHDLQSSLSKINTEYKFFEELRKQNCLIDPIDVTFGYRMEQERVEGNNSSLKLVNKKNMGSTIPLAAVFTKFFEIPQMFNEVLIYITSWSINDEHISNIMQTEFWKLKVGDSQDLILPLFIYEDDFECGNPLGAHVGINLMTGTYISFPFLPPQYRSKLEHIFVAQISHAQDVKLYPDHIVYSGIVKQLNDLAKEGIEINVDHQKYKIYFKLALIIGDNAGLNRALGFPKGFNGDGFCRFCTVTKKESTVLCSEDESLLLNENNYKQLLSENSENLKFRECIWNEVNQFHVTQNYSVDIVHDLFEGICCYDIGNVLYYYIRSKKLFSLDDFNDRLRYFPFTKRCNRPPLVSEVQLRKKTIKMSAAEMKNLILNLCAMLGELIPEGDCVWKLIIVLRKIVSLTLQTKISKEDIEKIAKLTKKHNKLYITFFGDLKPKFHFLTHYARVMSNIGPLIHIWTMRFEGKNRILKREAQTSNNKVYLPRTMALKNQLQLGTTFVSRVKFEDIISYKKIQKATEQIAIRIDGIENLVNYERIKYFNFNNYYYGDAGLLKLNNNKFPQYGNIHELYHLKSCTGTCSHSHFAMIVNIYCSVATRKHLQCFELQATDEYKIIHYDQLLFYEPRNIFKLSNGKNYVTFDIHQD